MSDWPILSTLVFFPLIGVLIVSFINDDTDIGKNNIRIVTLLTTIFVFILAAFIYSGFDAKEVQFQLQERSNWLGSGLTYHLGIDGISTLFVMLTSILTPFCILASWQSIKERLKAYMICFLLLETMLLGAFCSLNEILFYIFFEGSLIPIFILIGVWGGENRIQASYKFFLYNFLASVFMLVSIMTMYKIVNSLDIIDLSNYHFSNNMQYLLWFGFFLAFAIKMPIWPLHSLLRDVYVEAPIAGSAILAGVVLKLAGYGFLRFSLPMFPYASIHLAPLVLALSVIAIIYTSVVALVQTDIKRLIAYASVAHIGYVSLGIFALNKISISGAIFQMISHGLLAAGMFFCAGIIYYRTGSKKIASYGGLVNNMPVYATVFLIFTMANIGLPGTSGFIGEFLPLIGSFKVSGLATFLAASGVILSASYALFLYKRVVFGKLVQEKLKDIFDLSLREKFVLFPLVCFTICLGIFPMIVLNTIATSVNVLVDKLH